MSEKLFDNNKEVEILKGTRKTSFFLGLAIGVAATSTLALLGFFVLVLNNKGETLQDQPTAAVNQPTNQPADQPEAEEPTAVGEVLAVTSDDYVKGDSNAKVTLIEYSDFECPYCARHSSTMEQIWQGYGDKVRIVFRHFPLSIHPEAQKASESAECAGEQGKFWEMHDAIFEANLAKEMSESKWKEEAKNLDLDTSQFNDCLDSGKYAEKVKNQMADGSKAGVAGTPATFVNGQLVEGAYPYEHFAQIIDSFLE